MSGSGHPILFWDDVGFQYGQRFALEHVTCSLVGREIVGLLGQNGAGKTTLLSLGIGILDPDYGSIAVADDMAVGYMPQEYALFPDLTVKEHLSYALGLQGVPARRRSSEILALTSMVGIAGRVDDRVRSLSGGIRRRCSLAMALAGGPSALILDEPTVGVDPASRDEIHEIVRELKSSGMAILLSSHYISEVEELADRVIVLHHGQVLREGGVGDIANQGGSPTVRLRLADTDCEPDLDRAAGILSSLEARLIADPGGAIIELRSGPNGPTSIGTLLSAAMRAVTACDWEVADVEVLRGSLEAAFRDLTLGSRSAEGGSVG